MLVVSVLVRWALLAAAVALAAWVTPDVSLEGGFLPTMWVALLVSLANLLAYIALAVLPTPSSYALLAVLTVAVNSLAVWLVASWTDNLDVDGFLPAAGFVIMISVFSLVLARAVDRLLPGLGDTDADTRA